MTILLWSFPTVSLLAFGDLGIISLTFLSIAFGSGVLSEIDLNSFNWQALVMLGGSNILGKAVTSSKLLDNAVAQIMGVLPDDQALMAFCIFCIAALIACFVSHTVAAIILMPVIIEIGVQANCVIPLSVCGVFSISAAQALPFSSFPNVNSLLVVDDHATSYLGTMDYVKAGIPATLMCLVFIHAAGLPLCEALL